MYLSWVRLVRNKGVSLTRARMVPLLTTGALIAGCAYGNVVAEPSSFVVNSYYGSAYYNNQVSTTTMAELISSGATANLTHLTYAFAQVSGADPCAGIPPQMLQSDLQSLKSHNPNIKILISIGGASSDATFTGAIAHYGSAAAFAQACVPELMNATVGSGKVYQYVNGIDIDWEYPTASSERAYNQVLQAFRNELSVYAANNKTGYLMLTAAIGPEQSPYGWQYIDFTGSTYYPGAASQVDFFNVEYYNYAYDSSSDTMTASNAPLNDIEYNAGQLETTGGVPPNEIVVGIPFYGVHWTNVTSGGCSIGGPGTFDNPNTSYTAAPPYYYILQQIQNNSGTVQCGGVRTDTNGDAWVWLLDSSDDWYEFDNPTTIQQKLSFASTNSLGGVFAWNLQDDTTNGALLSAMVGQPNGYANDTSSVSVTATNGLLYNRIKHTGSETLTVTNTSGATISGPIQLVIAGLPPGVTATNNTGTFPNVNGNPYWTLNDGSPLGPGASTQVTVTFSYTTSSSWSLTFHVYSGNF